jgi:PKD repeat protein
MAGPFSRPWSMTCLMLFVMSLIWSLVMANTPPVAVAGDDQVVNIGAVVVFGASDSHDPDGNPLSYRWDFDDSDGLQTDSILIAPHHTYTSPGTYIVTLTVSDGIDNGTDTIVVTVQPNLPPSVDLGPDIEVSANEWFFIDTRNVSDPNGDALGYSWDFDASDGIQEESTEKMPRWRYTVPGAFKVTLTVSDGAFTVNGSMNITVMSTLVPVPGRSFNEEDSLAPDTRRSYLVPVSKGKGLEVTIRSTNGQVFDTYLFASKNFFKYTETGELVAISEGSRSGTTKASYSVKIGTTDDYYLMVKNPSDKDLTYKISIKVVTLGSGNRLPGPGAVDAGLALISATLMVTVLSRKGQKKGMGD